MSLRRFTRLLCLVVWLDCLLLATRGVYIADCEGQSGYLTNPHSCSDYIYCDGANSIYCSGQCTDEIDCASIIAAENGGASPPIISDSSSESTSAATAATTTSTSTPEDSSTSSSTSTSPSTTAETTETPSTTTSTTTSATDSTNANSSTTEPTTATTLSVRDSCVKGRNEKIPFPPNCNYYYNCLDGFLLLQQCPFGFGWDVNLKQCRDLRVAECATRP